MAKKRGKVRRVRRISKRSVSKKTTNKKAAAQRAPRKEKMTYAPLKSSLFAVSIIGFIGTIFFFERLGLTWGLTFLIFFIILFLAGLISLRYGPVTSSRE